MKEFAVKCKGSELIYTAIKIWIMDELDQDYIEIIHVISTEWQAYRITTEQMYSLMNYISMQQKLLNLERVSAEIGD